PRDESGLETRLELLMRVELAARFHAIDPQAQRRRHMRGRALDLAGRLGEADLRAAEFGDGKTAAVARARMGEIGGEERLADADGEGGEAERRDRGARRAKHRGAVDPGAGSGAVVAVDVILKAMRRDQHILDDEALAAGAGETGDM